ncbi:hypothetical protein HU200_033572 [Digitaria exilis]|uniref:Uncharacterized protein n=1 Tax=Digitaria exilis TaxID=1010633 RepID=A0A835EKM5_9POAL|nr:hypothetical protein HU200_033572 [Digitaria exilis]
MRSEILPGMLRHLGPAVSLRLCPQVRSAAFAHRLLYHDSLRLPARLSLWRGPRSLLAFGALLHRSSRSGRAPLTRGALLSRLIRLHCTSHLFTSLRRLFADCRLHWPLLRTSSSMACLKSRPPGVLSRATDAFPRALRAWRLALHARLQYLCRSPGSCWANFTLPARC